MALSTLLVSVNDMDGDSKDKNTKMKVLQSTFTITTFANVPRTVSKYSH